MCRVRQSIHWSVTTVQEIVFLEYQLPENVALVMVTRIDWVPLESMNSALVSLQSCLSLCICKDGTLIFLVHGFKETTIRKIEGKDASIGVHFGLKGLPLDGREALRLINGLPLLDTISRRPYQLTRTPTHHRFGSSAGSPYVHACRARYYRVHLFSCDP